MNDNIINAGQDILGRLFSGFRRTVLTWTFLAVSLLMLAVPSISDLAAWKRVDPVGLEIWFSHFSHWSINHLFWDLLVFVVLGMVVERTSRYLLIISILVASPVIIASTWLLEHHLSYRGLSGLDCTLYAIVLVIALKRSWVSQFGFLCFLGLLVGKSLFEITTGATLFVSDLPGGVTAVPWAHLSGALAGLIVAWAWCRKCRN